MTIPERTLCAGYERVIRQALCGGLNRDPYRDQYLCNPQEKTIVGMVRERLMVRVYGKALDKGRTAWFRVTEAGAAACGLELPSKEVLEARRKGELVLAKKKGRRKYVFSDMTPEKVHSIMEATGYGCKPTAFCYACGMKNTYILRFIRQGKNMPLYLAEKIKNFAAQEGVLWALE